MCFAYELVASDVGHFDSHSPPRRTIFGRVPRFLVVQKWRNASSPPEEPSAHPPPGIRPTAAPRNPHPITPNPRRSPPPDTNPRNQQRFSRNPPRRHGRLSPNPNHHPHSRIPGRSPGHLTQNRN